MMRDGGRRLRFQLLWDHSYLGDTPCLCLWWLWGRRDMFFCVLMAAGDSGNTGPHGDLSLMVLEPHCISRLLSRPQMLMSQGSI